MKPYKIETLTLNDLLQINLNIKANQVTLNAYLRLFTIDEAFSSIGLMEVSKNTLQDCSYRKIEDKGSYFLVTYINQTQEIYYKSKENEYYSIASNTKYNSKENKFVDLNGNETYYQGNYPYKLIRKDKKIYNITRKDEIIEKISDDRKVFTFIKDENNNYKQIVCQIENKIIEKIDIVCTENEIDVNFVNIEGINNSFIILNKDLCLEFIDKISSKSLKFYFQWDNIVGFYQEGYGGKYDEKNKVLIKYDYNKVLFFYSDSYELLCVYCFEGNKLYYFNKKGVISYLEYQKYKKGQLILEDYDYLKTLEVKPININNTYTAINNCIGEATFSGYHYGWKVTKTGDSNYKYQKNTSSIYSMFFENYFEGNSTRNNEIILKTTCRNLQINRTYQLMFFAKRLNLIGNCKVEVLYELDEEKETYLSKELQFNGEDFECFFYTFQIKEKINKVFLKITISNGCSLAISNFDMRNNQNNSSEYEYNEEGFLKKITCNGISTSVKNENGKINELTNKDNNITFDEEGNPLITSTGLYQDNYYQNGILCLQRVVYDKENITEDRCDYDSEGFLIAHLDKNNILTKYKYEYDKLRAIIYPRYMQNIIFEDKTLKSIFNSQIENVENYDEKNLLREQTSKNSNVNYIYDDNLNVREVYYNGLFINSFEYQDDHYSINKLLSEKRYGNCSYLFSYNEDNLLNNVSKKIQDETTLLFTQEYDQNNNLVALEDHLLNEKTIYKYDINDNLIKYTNPSLEIENFINDGVVTYQKYKFNQDNQKIILNDVNPVIKRTYKLASANLKQNNDLYFNFFDENSFNLIKDYYGNQDRIIETLTRKDNIELIHNEISYVKFNYYTDVNQKFIYKYESNILSNRTGFGCGFFFNPDFITTKQFLAEMKISDDLTINFYLKYNSSNNNFDLIINKVKDDFETSLGEVNSNIAFKEWNFLGVNAKQKEKNIELFIYINNYFVKLSIENSSFNGEKSYLQFGKYSFISLGQVHNYAGLMTAIMIDYNNEIQNEFLNNFLFNIKTGLNSTPLNITNNYPIYKTLNKYVYSLNITDTFIPLKTNLYSNKDDKPLEAIGNFFEFDEYVEHSLLRCGNSKLTYQTNLKNIGYVCFKTRFTSLTSKQGLISLFDIDNVYFSLIYVNQNLLHLQYKDKTFTINKKLDTNYHHYCLTYNDQKLSLYIDDEKYDFEIEKAYIYDNLILSIGSQASCYIDDNDEAKVTYTNLFNGFIEDVVYGTTYKLISEFNYIKMLLEKEIITNYYDVFNHLSMQAVKDNNKIVNYHVYTYKKIDNQVTDFISLERTNIKDFEYEYNESGLIEKCNNAVYEYDEFNQLVLFRPKDEDEFKYEYSNGNITSVTYNGTRIKAYGYNLNNLLIKFNAKTIKYNGLYISQILEDGNVEREFTYEGNRLTKIDDKINNQVIEYNYDINGLRTRKIINGKLVKFIYDLNGNLIKEEHYKESGNLEYVLVFIYDIEGRPLILEKYSFDHTLQERYYYLVNQLNEVVGLINKDGELEVQYGYSPYGEIEVLFDRSRNSISKINPFRYKCYYYDEETQYYYLTSRYYDPNIGRFISPDSVNY